MNKSQIIQKIAADSGASKQEVEGIVDAFLHEVIEGTAGSKQVQLDGFGIFKRVWRKERTARNPRTGDPVRVAARFDVKFKEYGKFTDAVQTIL